METAALAQAGAVISVSLGVAWAVTRIAIPLLRERVLDVPNERSSHRVPTPRGGGIGILLGIIAGLCASWKLGLAIPKFEVLASTAIIAAIGIIDDCRHGLSVALRLFVQFAAAGFVVYRLGGFTEPSGAFQFTNWSGMLLALIWIVGVCNIYNFLDGIDGFAALQASIAGVAICLLNPVGSFLSIGLCIAGASIGFLCHNWHPAKVFMGDTGSATLGFIFGVLPFQVELNMRLRALFVIAMCLWPFLSDGVFTIIRRTLNREAVWKAHRSHLYQRAVITGLAHDHVAIRVLGGSAVVAVLAILAERAGSVEFRFFVLAIAVTSFGFYYYWVKSLEANADLRIVSAGKSTASSKRSETKGIA